MQATAYLAFDGQCEAAFKFYEECLGGKIEMMMNYGQMPQTEQTNPERQNAIVHARMTVGNTLLMGGDAPTEYYSKPQGFSVCLAVDTPAEAERIFAAMTEGGKAQMPMAPTFWASRFGMVIDRFGTPWMIMCEQAA
jgi:PhnB protein